MVRKIVVLQPIAAKLQTIANLANFAYDPYNYSFFRDLNIPRLFLANLLSTNSAIVEFSIGGLCNCSCDFEIAQDLFKFDAITFLSLCISSTNKRIVLDAITTLYYMLGHAANGSIFICIDARTT